MGGMLNLVSIVIGLFAAPLILFAFLPFFGWALWLILPLPAMGALFGHLSSHRSGRTLNLVLLAVGGLRLMLGHGIF